MFKILRVCRGLFFFLLVLGVASVRCPSEERGAALLSALFEGDVEQARVLFKREPAAVIQRGGWSLWNNVIHGGHIESANFLLEKKVDVNACGPAGIRPLHLAAGGVNADILSLLLAYNAEVNVYCMDTHCLPRWTPLHYAAIYGDPWTVKLLWEKGAKINVPDGNNAMPLHYAAAHGMLETMEALLVRGAVVDAGDKKGRTPLYYAAHEGRMGYAEVLLQKGADVNVRDFDDQTPLHCAASRGLSETTRLLLENKAKVDIYDSNGRTPLHCAVLCGCWLAAKVLLEFKAKIEAVAEDNRTPLQLATDERVICVLVEAGADTSKIAKHDPTYELVEMARNKRCESQQRIYVCVQTEADGNLEQNVRCKGLMCRKRCRTEHESADQVG